MKIVVLDGHALNPGDISWDELRKLGDFELHERTPANLIVERAKEAEIIFTNKVTLNAEIMDQLPKLRYIGILATGINVVDIEAAKKRNIIVTNIPAYSTESVAQMVFAHILNLTQRVGDHSLDVNNGKWSRSIDFCYWDFPQIELQGLTLGIIGYGQIGKATGRIAKAFGMQVKVYNRSKVNDTTVEQVSLEQLFSSSDIVSLHCPLTKETEKMINKETISMMKTSAFIINTGRGLLIDEQALAEALNSGKIAGAGLDVLSTEPPKENNPLLNAINCFITPHIAWATKAARMRLMGIAAKNLTAFLENRPIHVVSNN